MARKQIEERVEGTKKKIFGIKEAIMSLTHGGNL